MDHTVSLLLEAALSNGQFTNWPKQLLADCTGKLNKRPTETVTCLESEVYLAPKHSKVEETTALTSSG